MLASDEPSILRGVAVDQCLYGTVVAEYDYDTIGFECRLFEFLEAHNRIYTTSALALFELTIGWMGRRGITMTWKKLLITAMIVSSGEYPSAANSSVHHVDEPTPTNRMERELEAQIKYLPRIDKFYPKNIDRTDLSTAATLVRVCVNSEGQLRGEPILVASSFIKDFDAASLSMAREGIYEAGKADGVALPGCVDLEILARYKYETTSTQIGAVAALRRSLERLVPSVDGDVEYLSVESSGATLVWKKKLWKLQDTVPIGLELERMFAALTRNEALFYCAVEAVRSSFKSGVSIRTWYQLPSGETIFIVVTNQDSCKKLK